MSTSRQAGVENSIDATELLTVLRAVDRGDFRPRMTGEAEDGAAGEVARTLNAILDRLEHFMATVRHAGAELGTEGRLTCDWAARPIGGAHDDGAGTWHETADYLRTFGCSLATQIRDLHNTLKALEGGVASPRMTVDVRGEILELRDRFNRFVERAEGRSGQPNA